MSFESFVIFQNNFLFIRKSLWTLKIFWQALTNKSSLYTIYVWLISICSDYLVFHQAWNELLLIDLDFVFLLTKTFIINSVLESTVCLKKLMKFDRFSEQTSRGNWRGWLSIWIPKFLLLLRADAFIWVTYLRNFMLIQFAGKRISGSEREDARGRKLFIEHKKFENTKGVN